ncbi:MAG: LysM domain-containing protein [Deltaproteobacteria bacterium]|nr:LysM domain-containing protein [Deltaproteobacteria bacterium]
MQKQSIPLIWAMVFLAGLSGLIQPDRSKAEESGTEVVSHTVSKGEWLFKILRESGYCQDDCRVLLPEIRALNPDIGDVEILKPGQVVFLPGRESETFAEDQAEAGSAENLIQAEDDEAAQVLPEWRSIEHVVQPGESVFKIFRRHGVLDGGVVSKDTMTAFHRLNPDLVDVNRITPGMRLLVPVRVPMASEKRQRDVADQTMAVDWPAVTWAMVERLGFVFSKGREVLIPAPGGRWWRIDLGAVRFARDPLGGQIVFVPQDMFKSWPDELKRLFPKTCVYGRPLTMAGLAPPLAEAYPGRLKFWTRNHPFIVHSRGVGIEAQAEALVQVECDGDSVLHVFTVSQSGGGEFPELLRSYLELARVYLVTIPPDGNLSAEEEDREAIGRGALFVPWIRGAKVRTGLLQVPGLADISGECPEDLSGYFACLKNEGLAAERTLYLSWKAQGGHVALSVPARVIDSKQTKVVLLDERTADPYLVALFSLKGYRCFAVRDME